jgi:S-DNA-T family DNA segregation ATPase FtsK/SpoIIIE
VHAPQWGRMTTCAQCGFTYGVLARPALPASMRAHGRAVAQRVDAGPDGLGVRRLQHEWSPLEYACHVRGLLLMQRDRLYVALVEDEPSFKPMYREERVAFDRYSAQSPTAVASQIVMGADLLAHAFDGLSEDQWARPLLYNFPGPARRDVEWVAHHTVHEMIHHLADIDRILGSR